MCRDRWEVDGDAAFGAGGCVSAECGERVEGRGGAVRSVGDARVGCVVDSFDSSESSSGRVQSSLSEELFFSSV